MDSSTISRFWSKVERREPSDCWTWIGTPWSRGYGRMVVGGRDVAAHRLAYMIAHGLESLDGGEVHHECGNRGCVNPSHLTFEDSHASHLKRHTDARTACRRGHEYVEGSHVVYPSGKRDCLECRRISRLAGAHEAAVAAYHRLVESGYFARRH